jgi:alkylation response protein AidB-like acyl-CoA dehydrogenase
MAEMAPDDDNIIRDQAARFAHAMQPYGALGRTSRDDAAWYPALATAGWTALLADEAAGGSGLGLDDLCQVAEQFGRHLLPVGYVAIAVACQALAATRPDHPALAACLAGGAPVVASLPDAPALIATLNAAGDIVLRGTAGAIPAAAEAACFVLAAVAGDVELLVYVPAAAVARQDRPAADGTMLADLVFDAVTLPAAAILAQGAEGATLLAELRQALQLGTAAGLVGSSAALLDRTLEHLRTRRQFGQMLGSFQALQHRAVDEYGEIELARALVHEAARVAGGSGALGHVLADAARVKADATALRVARWAVQMHGAMGFTDECDAGLFVKRALVQSRLHGTPEARRRNFARAATARAASDNRLFGAFHADSAEDATFRAEVATWLEANLPAELRDWPIRPDIAQARWWHGKLHAAGWIAPNWPVAEGGMGASLEQRLILADEMARIGAPEISSQAVVHIGPILIRFGTPAQKAEHLPPMLTGKRIWCQGYSEPNAGSDLASLTTVAEQDGDYLVITGQKIWSTWAQHADWMFALVRTDRAATDPRQGISMVLVDMRTAGIQPRPIRTIAGDEEFAEIFLDQVRVPLTNVVGGLNEGWKIANTLLEAERLMGSSPQRCVVALDRLRLLATQTGMLDDAAFADRLARAEIDLLALCAAYAPALAIYKAGGSPGSVTSILKIACADLQQHLADLLVEAAGEAALDLAPLRAGGRRVDVATAWLQVRRATIYGGTSEIQRNIVASRTLGLGRREGKPK